MSPAAKRLAGSAFAFVVTMGIVNLFGDVVYEGGAAINGPFMATLGAGAAAISIVAGAGEFLGYSLRAVAGWIADRTGKYWPITFVGYAINTLAVPAMALARSWPVAGAFIMLERTGRAIRKPTVEAMLSYSTGQLGAGWVYALNNALDETGATLGPLIVAFAIARGAGYRGAYAMLLVSVLLVFVALTAARLIFPVPARLGGGEHTARAAGFTRGFWLSMVGAACFGAGLMSFELISFHLSSRHVFPAQWIPVLLALGTVAGIAASLVLGRLYDRAGGATLAVAIVVSAGFSPLVFFGRAGAVVAGLALWGVGYAVQDSLFKAVVAERLPEGRRNFAFGIFYAGYGGGWLVGSVVAGLLYGRSRLALVVFAVAVQLAAAPILLAARRRPRR